MDKHYVCPVCGSVSAVPKACETGGCQLQGQPLKECTCEDGKHGMVASEQL